MRTISTTTTTSTTTLAPMASITYSSPITTKATTNSPWHSPIPYLFGGLAAMLGLIAFALLMLACSYWRLSSQSQSQNQEGGDNITGDLENKEGESEKNEAFKKYEEKILVIMAGDQGPTFLATPVCNMCGKHNLGKDFCDMEIGKSCESFNVSDEKETLDKDNNNHVFVHVATIDSTTTQGNNEDSQENREQRQQPNQ